MTEKWKPSVSTGHRRRLAVVGHLMRRRIPSYVSSTRALEETEVLPPMDSLREREGENSSTEGNGAQGQ